MFFEFDTNYIERISHLHVQERHLYACIGSQIVHFVDGQEQNKIKFDSRITAFAARDDGFLLALQDKSVITLNASQFAATRYT